MVKIEWTPGLAIGIELVDTQHKMLLEKLNDISEAIENQMGVDAITKTLDFMVDYTDFHFTAEEKHMTAHNYPGLAAHRLKHGELKKTLKNLVEDFEEEGATQALADAIDTFLGNWLIKHIEEVDLVFGTFLKENKITITDDA